MKLIEIMAAAWLASAPTPAPAPASEAAIDALIAVLPDRDLARTIDRTADPKQLARITEFNPGRADEIRPILETYQECISIVVNEGTVTMIRNGVRALGEAQVKRLTDFYRSPDFAEFVRLTERTDRGEALSDPETAKLGGILARYPIPQFHEAMAKQQEAMAQDAPLITKMTRCSLDKKQALIRAKLRYN